MRELDGGKGKTAWERTKWWRGDVGNENGEIFFERKEG
jgi:hypothetical protein